MGSSSLNKSQTFSMDEPVRRFGEENISFVGFELLEHFRGEFSSSVKANKTSSIMSWASDSEIFPNT